METHADVLEDKHKTVWTRMLSDLEDFLQERGGERMLFRSRENVEERRLSSRGRTVSKPTTTSMRR
eukprot:4066212-Pleurochrysis_carterae.AAC.1